MVAVRTESERLASVYGWEAPESSLFVLTGKAPGVSVCSFSWTISSTPLKQKVTLTIDPAITPRELADYYRRARKLLLKSTPRTLTEKHLRLAEFSADLPEPTDWNASREQWNLRHSKEHPDWTYESTQTFRRDVQQAYSRIADPGYFRQSQRKKPSVEPGEKTEEVEKGSTE